MKKSREFQETVKTLILSLIIAMGARVSIAESRNIPSESMLPTLKVKDRLIIEKISKFSGIERGDIVVFYPPFLEKEKKGIINDITRFLSLPDHTAYIKRTIGLPNETVEVRNGLVYIDGKPLKEDYIQEPPFYNMQPIKVPQDSIFVLGDNRNNSADSHVWGTLPIKYIVGKAFINFWPPERMGKIDRVKY
ncbi:MAG: signal peptidase I [Candidatus Sericytochromatia bacterium]